VHRRAAGIDAAEQKMHLDASLVQSAYDPPAPRIKVNAFDPGYTASELNHYQTMRTAQQAAAVVVRITGLADDGPSGGFFNAAGPLPW
jgi:hypothetical protein